MFDQLDEAEKIEILIKMTKGLIAFHEKTLKPVHSDIKPSNFLYKIVLKSNGKREIKVFLSDFGSAV